VDRRAAEETPQPLERLERVESQPLVVLLVLTELLHQELEVSHIIKILHLLLPPRLVESVPRPPRRQGPPVQQLQNVHL
jgi:hypothetical protein